MYKNGSRATVISRERYSKLLSQLGLSQRRGAKFLGLNERTSRRFVSGESPVDQRTAMLLEMMVQYDITPEEALAYIGKWEGAA